MKRSLFVLALSCLALTSCYTIEIINDQEPLSEHESTQDEWNHLGFSGFVNYTQDFQITELCPTRSWSMIGTQRGPKAVAAGLLLSVLGQVGSIVNFVWTPLTVNYQCAKSSSKVASAY